MVTIQFSLPADLVEEAKELGLLDSTKLAALLRSEIRKQAIEELLSIAPRLAAAGVEPMSEEEVVEEVRAARAEWHAART